MERFIIWPLAVLTLAMFLFDPRWFYDPLQTDIAADEGRVYEIGSATTSDFFWIEVEARYFARRYIDETQECDGGADRFRVDPEVVGPNGYFVTTHSADFVIECAQGLGPVSVFYEWRVYLWGWLPVMNPVTEHQRISSHRAARIAGGRGSAGQGGGCEWEAAFNECDALLQQLTEEAE